MPISPFPQEYLPSANILLTMKLKALWDLMRLDHGVMLFVAILIGSVIAGGGAVPDLLKLALSFLTALFLEASTFALNDYIDLEIDRKNKRDDRPLVRGDLKPSTALAIFYVLFPLGVVASFFVNLQCFAIALVTGLFSIVYDIKLKKVKALGNFYIAYIMAVPFLFGASAVSSSIPYVVWLLASIAFLAGAGREMMKDVMDFAGDKSQGVKSLPLYLGARGTCRVAALFYLIAVATSFVPFFLLSGTSYHMNLIYLFIVGLTDAMFLTMSAVLVAKAEPPLSLYRKLTLLAMAVGLLAFLVGAFTSW